MKLPVLFEGVKPALLGFAILSNLALLAQPTRSPSFIVILSDDQSWVGTSILMDPDDSETRSDYFQTPNLERLARRGMQFTDGYSPAPFCCPTRRSLQIGQTPARHIYQRDQKNWTAVYRKQLNIPGLLKQADPRYQTAHFGKWDHRFDQVRPREMGYDYSDGVTGNGTGGGKGTGGPAIREDPKLIYGVTRRAVDFLEQQARTGNPFYLQVSHYAVHLDIFYTRKAWDRVSFRHVGKKHYMPEFAAMTDDLDTGVGILLDKLDELGLQRDTYVIFLSDNGGRNTIPGAGEPKVPRNAPLRDGKGSMYEGGIRVPFIVVGPGVAAGSVSQVPVTALDILPTLADLAGVRNSVPESVDGGSLRSLLHNGGSGKVARARPFLFFHHAVQRRPQTALRLGDLKLVKTWKENRLELFDLSKDRSEAHNLANDLPQEREQLHQLMTDFLEEVRAETRQMDQR